MRRRTGSAGFTLVEVIVLVAVVSIGASVALPFLLAERRGRRIDEAHQRYVEVATVIDRFHTVTGRWPQQLTYLRGTVANTSKDICGFNLGARAGTWNTGGDGNFRVLNHFFTTTDATQLPMIIGLASASLSSQDVTGARLIQIVIPSVSEKDAQHLNLRIDAVATEDGQADALGLVRYTAAVGGLVTLRLSISTVSGDC